ncbi:leptin b [Sphaeramia orbicularis]|uniref:Leptin n=1 Tax=Sphaeramia orbicularis TaxID=375764 RepID=A0A673B3T6_9TELE|nr:leptin-B-like [Sphaeramia orbicularis]
MSILLAILYISVALPPDCTVLSTNGDSIDSILTIAQTTLVHIEKLRMTLPVTQPKVPVSPPIKGLTSITQYLAVLDNDLKNPSTDHLIQIQSDVSSLEGRVRSLAVTMNCPVQDRPAPQTHGNIFPETHFHLTLAKAQLYLEKFLRNKDKLKVC